MNKRIRKKHGVGEFREMCFTLRFQLADRLSDDEVEAFLDRFAADYLEPRGLACGGGGGRAWEVVVSGAEGGSATEADRPVFVLRDYRAGKNSFVESPDRHIGTWTNQGFRYTLADLKGQGSLRHIWTTRGDGPPYFEWEFYVDGETTPSIRGSDLDLVDAASRVTVPVAPVVLNCSVAFFISVAGSAPSTGFVQSNFVSRFGMKFAWKYAMLPSASA